MKTERLVILISELFEDELLLKYISMSLVMSNNYTFLISKYIKDYMLNTPLREQWLENYDNLQFYQLFRMGKDTFEKLLATLRNVDKDRCIEKTYTGGYKPINSKTCLLIFLWYMATQDSLLYIGDRFRVCSATVMNIVNKMLFLTMKLKKQYIGFPQTEAEMIEISRNFKTYPGVIGALDGTHIFIKVQINQQDSYVYRYRRHSINIMAICASNNIFTYIFVGFPGTAHDSRVFENSQLFLKIERHGANTIFIDEKKYHLIGDSAFGVKPWLMTPYKGNNLSRKQRYHNYRLSSSRVAIEHTFGFLKGRWRRLQYINTYNICKTVEVATAGCVLHNFCLLNCDAWNEEFLDAREIEGRIQQPQDDTLQGKIKRNDIANTLFL